MMVSVCRPARLCLSGSFCMNRLWIPGLCFCALFLTALPLHAQDADDTNLGPKLEEYSKLDAQLLELFTQKKYEQAADICRRQMKLVPESSEPHYNLACAEARLEHKDVALLELSMAIELGFTDSF